MAKQKSFTLIELLVVIVIIGILAGVIMISTSSSIDKANIAKVKVFEESIQNNLAANMISAWDADHITKTEAGNWTLNDKWGNNNGTFYNGTGVVCSSTSGSEACPQVVNDKQMGNVLSFDGVDDYIKIASPNNIPISNNSRTISLWTKPNIHKDNLWIWWGDANSNQGNGLRLFTGEKIRFYFWSNDLDVYTGDLTNKWHHIVAIYDNITNKQKVYVDGQLKEERTPSIPNTMNSDLYIGMRPDTEHFNGLLNNVQIYNQSIPDSEIKQNYIAGLSSMFANGSMSKEEYSERIKALAIK